MRRISGPWIGAIVCCVAIFAYEARANDWRAVISEPSDATSLRPLDRFVIAWQRHDDAAMQAALDDDAWSGHLRAWARARVAAERGDVDAALAAFERARSAWPATREEPPAVQAVFDRQRAFLALENERVDAARAIFGSPLRAHQDPVWDALNAWLAFVDGDATAALPSIGLGPRHGRSTDGIPSSCVAPWSISTEAMHMLPRARGSIASAISNGRNDSGWPWRSGTPSRTCARRSVTRRIGARSCDGWFASSVATTRSRSPAPPTPSKATPPSAHGCTSSCRTTLPTASSRRSRGVARNAERPRKLTDEQRAELDAYPLGVRRRSGHSVGLAAAFDAVALRYPETRRALEALWESAWMWE